MNDEIRRVINALIGIFDAMLEEHEELTARVISLGERLSAIEEPEQGELNLPEEETETGGRAKAHLPAYRTVYYRMDGEYRGAIKVGLVRKHLGVPVSSVRNSIEERRTVIHYAESGAEVFRFYLTEEEARA